MFWYLPCLRHHLGSEHSETNNNDLYLHGVQCLLASHNLSHTNFLILCEMAWWPCRTCGSPQGTYAYYGAKELPRARDGQPGRGKRSVRYELRAVGQTHDFSDKGRCQMDIYLVTDMARWSRTLIIWTLVYSFLRLYLIASKFKSLLFSLHNIDFRAGSLGRCLSG